MPSPEDIALEPVAETRARFLRLSIAPTREKLRDLSGAPWTPGPSVALACFLIALAGVVFGVVLAHAL